MLRHFEREKLIWDSNLPSSEKFILLALNSFVDGEGKCFPGQSRLGYMTGLSKRTVIRTIDTLEQKHILSRRRRAHGYHGRTTNEYSILYKNLITYQDSSPVSDAVTPGDTMAPSVSDTMSQDLSSINYPVDLSSFNCPDKDPPLPPHGEKRAKKSHSKISEPDVEQTTLIDLTDYTERSPKQGKREKTQPPQLSSDDVKIFSAIWNRLRLPRWSGWDGTCTTARSRCGRSRRGSRAVPRGWSAPKRAARSAAG